MSTPTIHRIADRQPEYLPGKTTWLWADNSAPIFGAQWHKSEHLPLIFPGPWTHWCHSDTRPTVVPEKTIAEAASTPEAAEKLVELFHGVSTQPSPDVQRVAEEIVPIEQHPMDELKAKLRRNEVATILTRFAAELTAKKDEEIEKLRLHLNSERQAKVERGDMIAEKDAFSDAQRIQIEYWQRRCGEEKQRAERAEAELAEAKKWSDAKTKLGDDLLCEVRELRAYRERMEWLHRGNDKDAEGFEWGVFRVKWDAQGQPVSVLHTLTDLTDLDAAMGASRMPRYYDQIADLQAQLIKEQDYSQELKAERDQLRAEVERLNKALDTKIGDVFPAADKIADLRAQLAAVREDREKILTEMERANKALAKIVTSQPLAFGDSVANRIECEVRSGLMAAIDAARKDTDKR